MLLKLLETLYILLLLIHPQRSAGCENKFQLEEQPLLKPDEIIYLVAQENRNTKPRAGRVSPKWQKETTRTTQVEYESDTNDEDLMKAHKVWSRWGKWRDCSVTCGEGVMSRYRLCVGGRCAPGELEEQHRPCSQSPCDPSDVDHLEAE